MSAPTFQAVGTLTSGVGPISPPWPTHQAGDIGLLVIESTGGQAAALSDDQGFVEVTNSPVSVLTGTSGTRVTVYWCRATSSSMAAPTVADPGNHLIGMIITARGCIDTGNPWDVITTDTKSTSNNTGSFPAITTTVNDTLIISLASRDTDSAAAWVGATTPLLTEQFDGGAVDGNGGGLYVGSTTLATAGTIGPFTSTLVGNSVNAMMTIALKSATSPSVSLSTADNDEQETTAPTLQFVGTDPQSDDIEYEVQISTDNTFATTNVDAVSSTDTGFVDVSNGADTHPFTSGNTVSYTVQSALSLGDYYWRVRGKDPSGSNTYGAWTTARVVHLFPTGRRATKVSIATVPSDSAHPYSSGAVALSSSDYSALDTSDDTRLEQDGGTTTKALITQKVQLSGQVAFDVDFEAQVNKAVVNDTVTLVRRTNSAAQSAVSSYSFSHITDTASNKLLVVGVHYFDSPSASVSGITYNGTALTKLRGDSNSTFATEIWYLVNPPEGTFTVAVTMTGSIYGLASACSFSGVNQSTPFNGNNGAGLAGDPISASITTTVDGCYFLGFASSSQASFSPGNGETELYETNATFVDCAAEYYQQTTAGSFAMTFNNSYFAHNENNAMSVAAIQPNVVSPSIKVDLWNFTTSAWVNFYNQTSPTANTDFSTTVDKSTGYTDYCDSTGWVYARAYADYIPSVNFLIDKFLVYALTGAIPHAITKAVKYSVKTTPSAITKSLAYRIKRTPSALTKSLVYRIRESYAIVRTNLVKNPSIETATNWFVSSGNMTISTDFAYEGSHSLKAVQAGAGGYGYIDVDVSGVAVGATIYCSCWFKMTAWTSQSALIAIKSTDFTTVYASSNTVGAVQDWTRLSCSFTKPSGLNTIRFICDQLNNGTWTGYYDGFLVEASSILGNYFSGDTSASGNDSFQWTGATNNSTSQQISHVAAQVTKSLYYAIHTTSVTSVNITKSLKYSLKTTPSALTKALKYSIKTTPSALTKSLVYRVRTNLPITKSLKYDIKHPVAITKALMYRIKVTPTALTKTLLYRVKLPTAITKGIVYRVKNQAAITKSLTYAILTIPTAITKSLHYSVRQSLPLTKSMTYIIKRPVSITKGLQYRIKASPSLTKALTYTVKTTPTAITKSLFYRVKPHAAITKSMQYRVLASAPALTKSMKYSIKQVIAIQKGLTYKVKTIPSAINKTLLYKVKPSIALAKTLQYAVKITPTAITKQLAYRLKTVPAITRDLTYRVKQPSAITLSMKYRLPKASFVITKQLAYAVRQQVAITKPMQYKVLTVPSAITKQLQYRIFASPTLSKTLAYRLKTSKSLTKSLSYRVITIPSAIQKTMSYRLAHVSIKLTKGLKYSTKANFNDKPHMDVLEDEQP